MSDLSQENVSKIKCMLIEGCFFGNPILEEESFILGYATRHNLKQEEVLEAAKSLIEENKKELGKIASRQRHLVEEVIKDTGDKKPRKGMKVALNLGDGETFVVVIESVRNGLLYGNTKNTPGYLEPTYIDGWPVESIQRP